jgi:hypothetical protein
VLGGYRNGDILPRDCGGCPLQAPRPALVKSAKLLGQTDRDGERAAPAPLPSRAAISYASLMDLERMLDTCRRDQWSVGDLDWTRKPRPMSHDDEIAIVQLFTDMAGIERLAAALFREQRRRVENPTLQAIFDTFVKDEIRHSHAAQMLADFYNVHHYRAYRTNKHLEAFFPHFINAVHHLSDDVANAYITGGELILDIALLRSINDYVADEMSEQAMRLINRDESRHIAIDYHMVDYYTSPAYEERLKSRPAVPLRDRAAASWTFVQMLYHAQPFSRDVFFVPMERVDPTGKRLREAFKRMQLLGMKQPVARRPFARFMRTLSDLFNHPVTGSLFGNAIARVAGVEPEVMGRLYTTEDLGRARTMTYDELAQEALSVKLGTMPVSSGE